MTRLARAELLLLVLLGLHTVDHAINQPSRTLPAGSGLIGLAGFTLVALAIVFALMRGSRFAAPIGLLAGIGTFAGFVAVHMPGIGPIADPYFDFDPNALSWVLLIAPMVTSLAVAALAFAALRVPQPRPAG